MVEIIGQRLKEGIKKRGLTQLKLAKETNIPQSTISRYTSAVAKSAIGGQEKRPNGGHLDYE